MMRRMIYAITSLACVIVSGCSSGERGSEELVTIDVSGTYPVKEIPATGIADISYVQLKSDKDEFVFRDSPIAITRNTFVIYDRSSGDFLFFTKEGKPKSRFNHKGNGPGEYVDVFQALYDEKRDELFTFFKNKVDVFSSAGEYKRSLSTPKESQLFDFLEWDDETLLIYDSSEQYRGGQNQLREMTGGDKGDIPDVSRQDVYASPFVLISKADGAMGGYVEIPRDSTVRLSAPFSVDGFSLVVMGQANRMMKYKDGVLLYNPETDTLFFCKKDRKPEPLWVRVPPVKSMSPIVYMNAFVEAGGYQFFETIPLVPERGRFPSTYLMRDKKDGSVYKQKIVLPDFPEKEITLVPRSLTKTRDAKTVFIELSADELQKAFDENKLSGELKDRVAAMGDEDNAIYLLLSLK